MWWIIIKTFLFIITEWRLKSFQTLASKREAADSGFGSVEKTPKCIAEYYDQAFGVIAGKQENKLLTIPKDDLRLRARFSHMRKSIHFQLHTCHDFFVMWHCHIVANDIDFTCT